jgi:hypothetical protein
MNPSKFIIVIIFPLIIICGCGDNNKVNLKGEPAAVAMAQSMLDALGGKAKWARLKSVYVRTLNFTPEQANNYVMEEWIELDAPKMISRQSSQISSVIQVLDRNDGWVIKNNDVELMSSQSITNLLKWHNQYLMRVLQILAEGGENREVKMNGERRFDFYENNIFVGGFKLNKDDLIESYFTKISQDLLNSIDFKGWREYKGMKYPLEVHSSARMAVYKTDYWDPRETTVEKAFNFSFNPNIVLEKFK